MWSAAAKEVDLYSWRSTRVSDDSEGRRYCIIAPRHEARLRSASELEA
jgi:hypothetical protein